MPLVHISYVWLCVAFSYLRGWMLGKTLRSCRAGTALFTFILQLSTYNKHLINTYRKNELILLWCTFRVQFSAVAHLCVTLSNPMDCSMPGFPVLHYLLDLLKLMFIESVKPSNHLISVIRFSSCLQFFPASESFPMSWLFPSGGQSIGFPSNEYSGLIFFRIDWFDLLAVQGTLKGLLQYHSSKASIL